MTPRRTSWLRAATLTSCFLSVEAIALSPGAASLASGMVAGAIGVGVAYPLDTVKVKIQAAAARRGPEADDGASMGFIGLVSDLVREDGVGVLYSGVSSTMLGQAAIKGVAFFAYQSARDALGDADA